MKKKTKITVSISLDKNLSKILNDTISNRSKYIEYLIYQDMIKNRVNGIEKILI